VILVVDYGLGNVRSIMNMLRRIGLPAVLSKDAADILAAGRIVLPGVGAFDSGMDLLRASGVCPALEEAVLERGVPVLGICLGMQMLGRSSEEGDATGLGWLPVETVRIEAGEQRVPHMGWNWVEPERTSPLFEAGVEPPRYYFLHSYAVRSDDRDVVLATTTYGSGFASAVGRGHIYGVQFHPEKSHRYGMDLFRRFAAIAA
jgi:imidazole glycerol-phosphate synthase subunit HisH